VQVAEAETPPTVAAWTKKALKEDVEHRLEGGASSAPENYTVLPRLVELRSDAGGDSKEVLRVCIVELTLLADKDGRIVARTRGRASSEGASEREVLQGAAQAATGRLASTLAALARAPRVATR
jgi:hypothetical protein